MSVKSRKKYSIKQAKQPERSPLAFQKQYIYAAMEDNAITSVIFFFFTCIGVGILFAEDHPLGVSFFVLLIFCFFAFSMIDFIRSFRIHRALSKIQYATEEARSLHCCKCTFLFKSVSKHTARIVCIIMQDENGTRFYYVYPETEAPFDSAKRNIKESFTDRDLTLTCYKGTNMVKALPKMPKYWPTLPEKR